MPEDARIILICVREDTLRFVPGEASPELAWQGSGKRALLIRSCVQDESILKVKMPIRIGPFYPSVLQGEGADIILNAN